MTRKKVNLAYITNDSMRKATFKKRKKGLIKKVNELTTLCGIDACAIIYSPYNPEPEVYPSSLGVQQVLTRFRRMPEMDQSKKMVNLESFLQQRIDKANEQLKKQRRNNREKEITQLMFRSLTGGASVLQGLNILDLNDLSSVIDQNLKEIDRRIERLSQRPVQDDCKLQLQGDDVAVQQAAAEGVPAAATDRPIGFEVANMENWHRAQPLLQPQWFMDLMKNCQEQQNLELVGDEAMQPFGENVETFRSDCMSVFVDT
ncbi:hypothetical protein TIFTF001_000004 [Ficus carica]|uniref:MADS-box domain-containing protein n=1 Tax=Ficus carica TaxID=3494 RepID=A0AA88D046_FICCA|nr:hypothetical protein TIFTF001_000004 [Ficus carica]